jgi:Uma2 family endonuclease
MSTTARIITEDDLLRLSADGNRYELVGGELRQMSPTGYDHGRCTGNLHVLLGAHVRRHGLGDVLAAETGFVLERTAAGKLTIRATDVAFVAKGRIPKDADRTRYLRFAPDLIVETLSPGDAPAEVQEKITSWIRAGVRVALTVDPESRSVTLHRATGEGVRLTHADELDLDEVISGFRCRVSEIFD